METTRNRVESIKIALISKNPEPLKDNDGHLYEKLRKSISKRGQLKNIIVCENEVGLYECIEGNKVLEIMQEIGHEEVNCLNVGQLSEVEKSILKIEISRDYFLTNYVKIAELLKSISQQDKIEMVCNTLPFNLRQAKKLIDLTEFNWSDFHENKQTEGQISLFDFESEIVIEEASGIELVNEKTAIIESPVESKHSAIEEIELIVEIETIAPKLVVDIQKYELTEIEKVDDVIETSLNTLFEEQNEIQQYENDLLEDVKAGLLDEETATSLKEEVLKIIEHKEGEIEVKPFFIDEKFQLVLNKFQHQIIANIPNFAKQSLENMWGQVDVNVDNIKIIHKESIISTKTIIIEKVMYVNKYGHNFSVKLVDIYNYLSKIDFE